SIVRILSNRRYLGDWVYNRKHCGKWARTENGEVTHNPGERQAACQYPEADWIVVPDWHPAIIDRETFALVEARLQHNREHKTPHVGGGEFVLNQLLICGACGLPMWGFNERGQRKYRCSGNMRFGASFCGCNTVNEARLLDAVVVKLKDELLSPEA